MNPKYYRLIPLLAGLGLLGLGNDVRANKPVDITEAEMSLLPRYCRDAQGFGYGDAYSNTSPRAAGWVALMGRTFWHIHHHCWALINVRRAQQPLVPAGRKRALLEEALGDFRYVVRNAPRDFVLLPEVYTWIGRTQAQLKQPNAVEAFVRAKALKPDYWPPYFHLAEFLNAHGKSADAMKVVRDGLAHVPNAKALLALYRDLGGKPGDIPPPLPPSKTAPLPESDADEEQPAEAATPQSPAEQAEAAQPATGSPSVPADGSRHP